MKSVEELLELFLGLAGSLCDELLGVVLEGFELTFDLPELFLVGQAVGVEQFLFVLDAFLVPRVSWSLVFASDFSWIAHGASLISSSSRQGPCLCFA